METHDKIRLDILIDAPLSNRLAALLDEQGVSGYTIFAAKGGKGEVGPWSRAGLITDVGQMQLFICVMDIDRRTHVLEALREQLADHIGYVTSSAVEVIRPGKFP
ncbi:MAG: hypothetical protein AAF661_03250 [Pseudomonadota bacterium]